MTAYDRPELCCDHSATWAGNLFTCKEVFADRAAVDSRDLRRLSRLKGWTTVYGANGALRDYCPRHCP